MEQQSGRTCGCGCGQPVAKGRQFVQGHDQRHKGNLKRAAKRGDVEAWHELHNRKWMDGGAIDRPFGVEIEFFGINPNDAIAYLQRAGFDARYEGYTHKQRTWWKLVTDSSVNTLGTGACCSGLELVSPIMHGEAGMSEVMRAIDALVEAGAVVDRTCGLHVHISAHGMDGSAIKNVVHTYHNCREAINAMVAPNRWYTSMALPWDATSLRYMEFYDDARRLRHGTFNRYHDVNLAAYVKYGTIEFRQHEGCLDGQKVMDWIRFLMAMMRLASCGGRQLYACDDTAEVLRRLHIDGSVADRLLERKAYWQERGEMPALESLR
jgi:hypothetical protein